MMQSQEQKRGKKRQREEDGNGQGIDYQSFVEISQVLEGYDDEGNPQHNENGSQSSGDEDSIEQVESEDESDEMEDENDEGYDVVQNDEGNNEEEENGEPNEMDLSGVALNNTSFSTCLVKGHSFKLISQSEKLIHGAINDSKFHCWWESHAFDGKIYQIPCQRNDRRRIFYMFGCFCSWNCALSWNDSDPINFRQREMRKSWIMEMAGCNQILHAPSPVLLICKGGTLTIEELRAMSKMNISSRVIMPTEIQEYRFVNQQPLLGYTLPTEPSEKENAALRTVVEKILQMTNPVDLSGTKFDVQIPETVVERLRDHQHQQQQANASVSNNNADDTTSQSKNEDDDMAELQNNIAQAAYGAVMAKNRGRGSRGGRARPKPKRGLPPNHGLGGGLLSHQDDMVTDTL